MNQDYSYKILNIESVQPLISSMIRIRTGVSQIGVDL